ncbi:hypothetical protein ScalyP_jg7977 [Parmales sp. scaly parma]|nr:hypothetical protein ScalyP_jg7977 [Parmales sp. scaly parma]|tara:strand:- start:63 stop:569 length:507 start_codon:yes stop_codon:yes gene_type:complete
MIRLLFFLAALSLAPLGQKITEEEAKAFQDILSWHPKSPDRLNFLLEEEDWSNLRVEFNLIDADQNDVATIEEALFLLSEFSDHDNIEQFINFCEESNEEESLCDFISYAFSRGAYDRVGIEYDENEYDMRQAMFVESVATIMIDASAQDLRLLGILVDEDGNIIDEL